MLSIIVEQIDKSYVSSNEAPLDKRTLYQTKSEFLSAPENKYVETTNLITETTEIDSTRFIGQKVVIQADPENDGKPCEYWFRDGITDADLVKYTTANAALDIDVETDTDIDSDEDSVMIKTEHTNIVHGDKNWDFNHLPTVNATTAGVMDSAMFEAFGTMQGDISQLQSMLQGLPRTAVAAGLGSEPEQESLTNAFTEAIGSVPNPNDRLVNIDNNTEWIFGNAGLWQFLSTAEIDLATQDNAGLVQHSTLDGCVGYYVAGVGQVNGWSDLKAAVQGNTTNIGNLQTALNGKASQAALEAEASARQTADGNLQAALNGKQNALSGTASQFVMGNGTFKDMLKNAGSVDFDTLTETGMYRVQGNINAPSSSNSSNWVVCVFAGTASDGLLQIAWYYNTSNSDTYWRRRVGNSSWNNWNRFVTLPDTRNSCRVITSLSSSGYALLGYLREGNDYATTAIIDFLGGLGGSWSNINAQISARIEVQIYNNASN